MFIEWCAVLVCKARICHEGTKAGKYLEMDSSSYLRVFVAEF